MAAALALLVGCGTAGGGTGLACTEIGAPKGVSVTIPAETAPSVHSAQLEICGEECRVYPVQLMPGSDTVDLGCDGTTPDSTCSASSTPNGTLVGFVDDPELTLDEVELALTVTGSAGAVVHRLTAVPRLVYPNGEDCPGEAEQLTVVLEEDGLRVAGDY